MTRRVLFFWLLLPSILALSIAFAGASPMVQPVGSAQAVLTFVPDPPHVGSVRGNVQLVGADAAKVRSTTLAFSTSMPRMSMNGPSGIARRSGDTFAFDLQIGMATDWTVVLRFTGAISGTATYRFAVAGEPAGDMGAMSGMASAGGNPLPWRTAVFALLVVIIIGYFLLRRDRRPVALALGAGAIVAIVILAIAQARYTQPPMDMAAMENVSGSAPIPVTVVRVHVGDPSDRIVAPGVVEPYLMQNIVTRASGILEKFNAYNGDRIRAGQQIAYLQAPELGSNAAAANAAAAAARVAAMHHAPTAVNIASNEISSAHNDLNTTIADQTAKAQQAKYWANEIERERTLLREGAVSSQEYEDEQAQAAAAQAALVAAQQRVASMRQQLSIAQSKAADARADVTLMQAQYEQAVGQAQTQDTLAAYRSVTAADDAIVVKRLIDPGVYVPAGTAIVQVAVIDKLRIQASVSQNDLTRVALGDAIDARLANGSIIHGRVTSITPVADATTHTAMVEAIIENDGERVQPGGFVRVTIRSRGPGASGIAIPSIAVMGGSMSPSIWLDVNGAAHRAPITILSNDGVTAVVQGDIPKNADVVTDGGPLLQEGQAIAAVSQ